MKFRNILLMSAAVLFCSASISATSAYNTWVSGSGVDSGTCGAFATPCATFQGALNNTTAGGVITAKDAGNFGPVNIGQSVTINGSNLGSISFNSSGISAGIYISGAANVTVQNLTINGLGLGNYGIYAYGGIVTVDNCKIMNFTTEGIAFGGPGNLTVENSRFESFIGTSEIIGIDIRSTGGENVVVRNTVIDASPVSNSSNYGFYVNSGTEPVQASLQNVTIMGAGYKAVWVGSGVTQITGSVITQSGFGVEASNGATVSVASSLITANTIGVCSNASSKIRLDNNDIYDNTTAIGNCGGIVKTSTTNKTSGTISIPASDVSDSVTF